MKIPKCPIKATCRAHRTSFRISKFEFCCFLLVQILGHFRSLSPEYQATDGASWLDVALGFLDWWMCSGTTSLTWMTWRLSPRILDIWTFPWMVTGCHSWWWQKFVKYILWASANGRFAHVCLLNCQSEVPGVWGLPVEFMDMQKRIVLHCGSIESSNLITRCSAASFRAVHWGYLWSKDALVWELQRILKANGNGKQDPTAIQVSYIYRTSTRTSLTSSLNTGNLPIGYPCPNFRLAINFADLKASLILWVCLQGLQIIHACFVFEERINRPLEQKSLGVQKHEDFKFSEHPVVMLAAPGQGNRDASADRGEASYHGIPITPSTPRTPKLVGFKFDSSQIQDDWNISKRDQNLQSLGLDHQGNSLDSMDLKTAGCIELPELQCALKKQLEDQQSEGWEDSKKDIGGLNLGKVGIFMEN